MATTDTKTTTTDTDTDTAQVGTRQDLPTHERTTPRRLVRPAAAVAGVALAATVAGALVLLDGPDPVTASYVGDWKDVYVQEVGDGATSEHPGDWKDIHLGELGRTPDGEYTGDWKDLLVSPTTPRG